MEGSEFPIFQIHQPRTYPREREKSTSCCYFGDNKRNLKVQHQSRRSWNVKQADVSRWNDSASSSYRRTRSRAVVKVFDRSVGAGVFCSEAPWPVEEAKSGNTWMTFDPARLPAIPPFLFLCIHRARFAAHPPATPPFVFIPTCRRVSRLIFSCKGDFVVVFVSLSRSFYHFLPGSFIKELQRTSRSLVFLFPYRQ